MGLSQDAGAGPVALDSSLWIYFIEEQPLFLPLIRPLFVAAEAGELRLLTSELTLLEVLVVPYRTGDGALAARYEGLLADSRGVELVPLDRVQLRTSARLRSLHGSLKSPDAIQISAALSRGCSAFVTNDRRLPTIPGLRILQLSEYA